MLVYDSIFFTALSIVLLIALTKWYSLGRRLAIPVLAVDLAVHAFLNIDIIRAAVDAAAIISVISEILSERKSASNSMLAPKNRLLSGLMFVFTGFLMASYGAPQILVVGIIITLLACYELSRHPKAASKIKKYSMKITKLRSLILFITVFSINNFVVHIFVNPEDTLVGNIIYAIFSGTIFGIIFYLIDRKTNFFNE